MENSFATLCSLLPVMSRHWFIARRSLRNIVISALFKVTMYRQFARKVGTSANSALIRSYLPRLKLLARLAIARERTPSFIQRIQGDSHVSTSTPSCEKNRCNLSPAHACSTRGNRIMNAASAFTSCGTSVGYSVR